MLRRLAASMLVVYMLVSYMIPAKTTGHAGGDHDVAAEIFERADERRTAAKNDLESRRTSSSSNIKQAACEIHVETISATMKDRASTAAMHIEELDTIFENLEAYHATYATELSDYDQYIARTEAANNEARIQAGVLSILNDEIDCTDTEVASNVEAFRASAIEAHKALDGYRLALIELAKAMTMNESMQ